MIVLQLVIGESGSVPPPIPNPPLVPPTSRDADWQKLYRQADLLYHPGKRPDFERLKPQEECYGSKNRTHDLPDSNCTSLWWPGLGNGFLGSIAQSPTLRIAGFFSGDYGRYTAGRTIPPIPSDGFSNKMLAYRASIPAYASSIIMNGTEMLVGSARTALNIRDSVYYERSSLSGGGELELRTYFHRTRRNLIVTEIVLDCTRCVTSGGGATVTLRAFSGEPPLDVIFQQRDVGLTGSSPRQLIGLLRAPENTAPSTAHLYDTNHTLGYVHDLCPATLTAAVGETANVQLLSVLTVSSEVDVQKNGGSSVLGEAGEAPREAKEGVVTRAVQIYQAAKAIAPAQLLDEHVRGWAALWESGGVELATADLALQQTTNATLYYLLMSTRPDWAHATLTPSSIAAGAPYPHGYYGTTFWDQDTFMAPPLMVFHPQVAENLLRNRLYQLPAYKVNAEAFGLRGAYIPWEVGFTGGFARDNRINHIEVHIAADVALFARQYHQLTRNTTFLRELYPLLSAIADFVVSRANRTNDQGWLSVETVEPPDEKPEDCDNDIFTNAVGVQALETALEAATLPGVSVPAAKKTQWQKAASTLKFGFAELKDGRLIHKEYDQYQVDKNFSTAHHPSSQIGQGDTVLLGFPLQFNASHRIWRGRKDELRLNDIVYYGPHVDPQGSYMTAGHYVIAWLERPHRDLGNASMWFARGRAKNYAPWRLWSEHDGNDGGAVNFVTAGGMFLQSLVFGYAGLRFSNDGVSMDPLLPPGVSAMKLRGVNYVDAEFDIHVEKTGARFVRRDCAGDSRRVVVQQADNGVYWLTLR